MLVVVDDDRLDEDMWGCGKGLQQCDWISNWLLLNVKRSTHDWLLRQTSAFYHPWVQYIQFIE